MDERIKKELQIVERNLSQILVGGDGAILMGDALIRIRRLLEEGKDKDEQDIC